MTENGHDDELARRERADRVREAIQEIQSRPPGHSAGPPRTPREFTEERAREAAAEERERHEGAGDEDEDEDD